MQLRTDTAFVRQLKGLRTPAALTLRGQDGTTHKSHGELLFTEYGVSGIAVMDLSRFATEGDRLLIDFLPQTALSDAASLLSRVCREDGERPLEQLLTGIVHNRIGTALLRTVLPARKLSAPCATLTNAELAAVADALKGFAVKVLGVKGFADAQVTAGGMTLSEFTDTLESSRVPGLFACGEILDIDGKCGGYNLTFAWSSGRLAGFAAAQKSKNR